MVLWTEGQVADQAHQGLSRGEGWGERYEKRTKTLSIIIFISKK